ncbi:MAG TPA: prepilin-type N-terminal cleavage/methylation domain-containing protein [Thermoanaerobaculia bacterium]|nr:prepilin-type N-terminal cleavage/methylation domain-containing protein [Thermoanaerobaculia bacterium]
MARALRSHGAGRFLNGSRNVMVGLNRRRGTAGFTLIELLIVVAIIGIIAAMLIPNFIGALHRSRQKRTMGDIKIIGVAMSNWATDNAGAAAAGQTTVMLSDWAGTSDLDAIRQALSPIYARFVPAQDAWGNALVYRLALENPSADRAMLIASPGLGGELVETFTPGTFDPLDFAEDIVWADGTFLRAPRAYAVQP